MSGRIPLELLEELEKDEEALPKVPVYFNQFSKPDDEEQSRENYKTFLAEKRKAETAKEIKQQKAELARKIAEKKREAEEDKRKKKKAKKMAESSKSYRTKRPTGKSTRRGRGRNAMKDQALSPESSSDADSSSPETLDDASPSKVTLSKEIQQHLQKLRNEFAKERAEMEKASRNHLDHSANDDVLLLGDINGYDPLIDDINVKVRCQGKILVKRIRRVDKLAEVFQHIAAEHNVPAAQIVIFFRDLPISVNDTPKKLGMSLADILECVIFPSTGSSQENINCINLKLQSKDSKVKTVISVHAVDPFSVMMEKYAEMKGLPLDKLLFEFDGDKILPTQTALELDIEDENVIDVKVVS